MNRSIGLLLCAGTLVLAGARADEPAQPETSAPKPVADSELSLYPGSVFEVPNPSGFEPNDGDPGDNARLPRAFPIAPPRVPHTIAGFETITFKANPCLDCHALDAGADAPELPPSHRTDLRRAPDKVESAVAGARWQCLACHVPTTDAKPLRANSAAPQPAHH